MLLKIWKEEQQMIGKTFSKVRMASDIITGRKLKKPGVELIALQELLSHAVTKAFLDFR